MIPTCPTDLVHAPAERVWELLTIPREFSKWSETRLIAGPARPLTVGDCLVLGSGFTNRMKVYLDVLAAKPLQELVLRVRLPFGIVNHERVRITRIDQDHCRVTYN